MSLFQLVAPLTETAIVDRACKDPDCARIISRGMPYFPVASHNASRPPRNVCRSCFEKIMKRGGTMICEKQDQDQPPDPRDVQAAVRASRSNASVNPPAVVPIPQASGRGTRHLPPAQPPRGPASLMLPPLAPAQHSLHTGPHVHVPSAWLSAGPSGPSRTTNHSKPSSVPSRSVPSTTPTHFGSGYSQHHELYFAETGRWSASANTLGPLVETISLSISALHDGGTRKGRSPGTPFGNIVEGKKGISARSTAKILAEIARKTVNPLILAFCPEFPWRPEEFVVRDEAWVDLSNHEETPETAQGYFYRECLHLKVKGFVFKTKQFHLSVVVPQNQWDEYLQFVAQQEAHTPSTEPSMSRAPPAHTTEFASRHRTRKAASLRTQAQVASSNTSQPTSPSLPLFFESEDSSGEAQESLMQPPAMSTPLSFKRSHQAMHSRAGSVTSATGKSPPTKKAVVIKTEPSSPDRNNLRDALRVGGAADLDSSQLLKGVIYQVDFYPIPTISIEEILSKPNYCKFDLDPKKMVTSLHPGQLRLLDGQGNSFVGAGAFKTAHTATLILSKPADAGIGSHAHEEIIVKRPYLRQANQPLMQASPFKRLQPKEESAMLFREANVLYWAKALFKLSEDFIAKRLAKASEPPPFQIPSIRFVDAGLAFRYQNNPPKGRTPSVECTYLCEEEIKDANTAFIKFVHNGDCVPLLEPYEPGYEIAQFLVFTQHVQYVKTKGLAYVSDYQGTTSLLTDPQILTHPAIGRDLFCEGNLERALEAFQDDHICNHFCKWPGFKLAAFGKSWKGKGKEADPVILSSDSD